MSTEPASPEPPDHGATSAWVRPVAVILSCLVLGFVGGWLLRGDDGDVTVLAPTAIGGGVAGTTPDATDAAPGTTAAVTDAATVTTGTVPAETGGTTPAETTGTVPGETGGTTGTAAAPPGGERADVSLAVLNGTAVAGLAADTAGRAETLGYGDVVTGNAPASTLPSVVYFRPGARPAAVRAAGDLEIVTVRPIPRSGDLADAAPADAQVVVVLGSG